MYLHCTAALRCRCSEKHGKAIRFGKVDIDDQDSIASKSGITAVPTFRFFEGGKVSWGGWFGVPLHGHEKFDAGEVCTRAPLPCLPGGPHLCMLCVPWSWSSNWDCVMAMDGVGWMGSSWARYAAALDAFFCVFTGIVLLVAAVLCRAPRAALVDAAAPTAHI